MTPSIIDDTRADLIQDEGVKLHVYQDTRGIWSLGVGINVDPRGPGITISEAFYLCDNRIEKAVLQLIGKYPWFNKIDHVRQSAFINLCYNLGIEGISKFTKAIDAAAKGDWATCRDEIIVHSLWASQVQPSRRERIDKMLSIGAR